MVSKSVSCQRVRAATLFSFRDSGIHPKLTTNLHANGHRTILSRQPRHAGRRAAHASEPLLQQAKPNTERPRTHGEHDPRPHFRQLRRLRSIRACFHHTSFFCRRMRIRSGLTTSQNHGNPLSDTPHIRFTSFGQAPWRRTLLTHLPSLVPHPWGQRTGAPPCQKRPISPTSASHPLRRPH